MLVNLVFVLWALVGLIGRVHGKCSLAPIANNDRSIAYACIHGDLSDLDELSSEAEWIEFSVSRFQVIPDDAFHRFKNLRRLSFYNCHMNYIESAAFRGLHRLDWLIFHGTRIHVVKAAWFQHLENLRKLILDRCGLVHIEPNVFHMLPRLETLDLRDNDLDCLSVDELSHMRSLRTVRIDGNPWLCDCRRQMEQFFCKRRIVQRKQCETVHLQCMAHIHIPILPQKVIIEPIKHYERHGNQFQTSVLTSLNRLPDKTTWIQISGLRIDRLPAYVFFRFGNSLRNLELRDCSIGVIEPGAFAGLHQLQRLTLIGNRLPTITSHWFRDLVTLSQLILVRNGIQHIESGALRPLTNSLRHLDVRYNRLQCLPVDDFKHFTHFERLDVIGNPLKCDCRQYLQSELTKHNIGFEINAGRCYENDSDFTGGEQQRIEFPITSVGHVHWTSFEENLHEMNVTITRPTPIIPITDTERPPIYSRMCTSDSTDQSGRTFTCSGITSFRQLNNIPHSTHTIRIILSNLKTIPSRAFARFDGYLTRLELRDCGIEKIDYRAFVDLYNLQHLSLHSNQIETITSKTLEGLTKLRHLDLSRNHIYRITNDVFDALPYLHSLDISENYMNCIGVEYMTSSMPYLYNLRVSGNPWSCLCGSKLANFLDSRRIHYDRVSLFDVNDDCYVTGVPGVPPTVTIPKVTTTEPPSVFIRNETLKGTCTPSGLVYRCVGGNLMLLKSIPHNVVAIEFQEGDLPNLPAGALYNFRHLQELTIRNSRLRTIEIDAFNGLESLEKLTIQDNPLTSIEADRFNIKNLEKLDLRGNSIKYISANAFRHLRRLIYLNLEGNDLQCIFTSDLDDMPNLHIVEFSGNPIKWRCRMDLEQFLETRKIKFVRIEDTCEGKKIMRNLLYENRTVESGECPPECSMANRISQEGMISFTIFMLLRVIRIH